MSASVCPGPAPSSPLVAEGEHPHADAAEEVRAWLVTARGGAPFLSAGDGQRLADWLEAGVPVRDLLRAIDETSARRRAKRLRQAFSLRTIEPALKRPGAGSLRRSQAIPSPDAVPWPDARPLVAELAALVARDGPGDSAYLQVSRRVREFFDRVWAELAPFHSVLRAAALEDLGAIADELDDDTRAALCEEYARERVRSHYPELRSGGLLG